MIKVIIAIIIVLLILGAVSVGVIYYMISKKSKNSGNGTNAGGTNNGGTNAGGTNTGGTNAGGTNNGGTNAGGTNTGGANAGGTNTGGTNTGGTVVISPIITEPVISNGIYRLKSKYSDSCTAPTYLRWRYCSHTAKHQTTVSPYEENTTKWRFNLVEGNDIYTIRTNRGPQDGCYIYLGDVASTSKLVEQPQKYRVAMINGVYSIMNIDSGRYLGMKACSSFDPLFGVNSDNSLWYLEPV